MGGWDQEDGFEEVPLDHPAVPALKPASNSSKLLGGSGGGNETARLRKQVAELQAGLEAAEAVSGRDAVHLVRYWQADSVRPSNPGDIMMHSMSVSQLWVCAGSMNSAHLSPRMQSRHTLHWLSRPQRIQQRSWRMCARRCGGRRSWRVMPTQGQQWYGDDALFTIAAQ
jgi:hypothetical protein